MKSKPQNDYLKRMGEQNKKEDREIKMKKDKKKKRK